MGKPAARLADNTAHGGLITGPGVPTVMIGKKPAATLGDMHTCPMATPATPPIPHVGGPIILGSTGVFIGKKPAARMGDMAVCVGPPSTIILGAVNVLIGEVGSGSSASSANKASKAKGAQITGPKKVKALEPEDFSDTSDKSPFIDVIFKDGAGKIINGLLYQILGPSNEEIIGSSTIAGQANHVGLAKDGQFSMDLGAVANCKWSATESKPGEKLTLEADIDIEESSSTLLLQIHNFNNEGSQLVHSEDVSISGKKLKHNWTIPTEGMALQKLQFSISRGNLMGVSNYLEIHDFAEINLKTEDGNPITDLEYYMYFADGSIRNGKLDKDGHAVEENVPPGEYSVKFIKAES